MAHAKINKTLIDTTPRPETGKTVRIMDSELIGFGVDIGARSVTFFVRRRVGGRDGAMRREKIGAFPVMTPAEARERARAALVAISSDEPRRATKRATSLVQIPTLQEALNKYLEVRATTGTPMRASTAGEYRQQIEKHLKDWLSWPVTDIKKPDVRQRHLELTAGAGPIGANRVFDYLSAVLNWSSAFYSVGEDELIPSNPCKVLTRERQRNEEHRRQTFIQSSDLAKFWAACHALPGRLLRWNEQAEVTRDLLLTALFTGMRPGEAARILVDRVDLERKYFILDDPKRNGKQFWVPFASPLQEILARRIEHAKLAGSSHVFPAMGHHGDAKIVRTRDHVEKLRADVPGFVLNDLRRTFTTVVGNMNPAPPHLVLKRLLNHKSLVVDRSDVTAGYYGSDIDALRPHVEVIANEILRLAGQRPEKQKVKRPS